MKSILPILALGVMTVSAAAVPDGEGWYVRRAEGVEEENLPTVDLEVIDDRFEGITFTGTAKSIYEEMKALKPELFADEEDIAEEAHALAERQGSISCSWGSQVPQYMNCIEGQVYLERLGQARCGVNGGSSTCARVSCSRSCGMFLCNKRSASRWVRCGSIARDIVAIANRCSNVFGNVRGRRDFENHFIGLGRQSC